MATAIPTVRMEHAMLHCRRCRIFCHFLSCLGSYTTIPLSSDYEQYNPKHPQTTYHTALHAARTARTKRLALLIPAIGILELLQQAPDGRKLPVGAGAPKLCLVLLDELLEGHSHFAGPTKAVE